MVQQFTQMIDLNKTIDFSKLEEIEENNLIDQIFIRQRSLGEQNPDILMKIIFLSEINRVHATKKKWDYVKINRKNDWERNNWCYCFFFSSDFFFLALAKIFESKEIEREFKELIYELIPALNECERCEILKYKYCYKFSSRCSLCRKARCTNCYWYNNSIKILVENCSNKSFVYIVNILCDLYNISNYSFDFFDDLKPIKEKIKEKNVIFFKKNLCRKHYIKYENYSNNKVLYLFI